MVTVQKKTPLRAPKKTLRSLLPKTAQSMAWDGKKFIAIPDQDIDSWLEDLIDGIEATIALQDDSPRVSQEDVKKMFGIQ